MADEQTTRSYHSPLRDRRAAETRELVLESLAELITERGTTEFSVQEVADRAGVSLRTVYRYFDNRQALLDGLTELVDQRLDELRRADGVQWQGLEALDVDDVLAIIPGVFARLDKLAPLSSAMALLSAGGRRRSTGHDERTEAFREILAEPLADMDDAQARATFAVVRHLLSSTTWFALREEFGLEGREAGQAVRRAVAALLDRTA